MYGVKNILKSSKLRLALNRFILQLNIRPHQTFVMMLLSALFCIKILNVKRLVQYCLLVFRQTIGVRQTPAFCNIDWDFLKIA